MTGSSDPGPITGAAKRRIEKETGKDLSGWSGPDVIFDRGEYKVEWYPPNEVHEEGRMTVYQTGDWDLYHPDGESFSGRMIRFHDRRWIGILKANGVIPGLAISSWMYFKDMTLR